MKNIPNYTNRPKFVLMCGLPCAGKSYKAQELSTNHDAEIFSSDALREEMFNDVNHQADNNKLFIELHRRIKDCLKSGKSAIYDATNINYKRRMAFLEELKNIPCEKICVLMATPYEECLKRNEERDRKVPEEVIKRMYTNFTIPYWYEGWDDIKIIYAEGAKGSYGDVSDWALSVMDYSQQNSHHALTLGQHCVNAFSYIYNRPQKHYEISTAALIHDCGKPKTATFINARGEASEECHYYNHQHVGSYDSLFFGGIDDHLYVAALILWHMQPYFNKEEKTKLKYKQLWGEVLYNDIMFLHEADKAAH